MSSPEQLSSNGERGIESAGNAARERQAELLASLENKELSPDRSAELANHTRHDAEKAAVSHEHPRNETAHNADDSHSIRPTNTRRARNKAYKDILDQVQIELDPASRTFSKVIHQPVIEKASNAIGATVARPNALLFGALFAFLISGVVYAVARHYGYPLSGFEAIGSFAIGWVFGLIVDVVRSAIRHR